MHFYMFIEVSLLCKRQETPLEVTLVRTLICVDPQVIKEIVPLPEVLATVFFIALQNFDDSLGFRILESEYSVFVCRRWVLFNLYRF